MLCGNAAAAIVAASPQQKPPYDRNVMVPADRMIAFRASRAGEYKAFAGAKSVPHDREETADATAQATEPKDCQPPKNAREQAILRLEGNGERWQRIAHEESLRHSGG